MYTCHVTVTTATGVSHVHMSCDCHMTATRMSHANSLRPVGMEYWRMEDSFQEH